jgi:hypothetical protein
MQKSGASAGATAAAGVMHIQSASVNAASGAIAQMQALTKPPTEEELYAQRLQVQETKQLAYKAALPQCLPKELSVLTTEYTAMRMIKDKDDFGRCIQECRDGCFELESIKEYLDRDPIKHIALKIYYVGFTPLMLAAGSKPETHEARPQLMRLLLSYPQDINARYTKEPNGTALHVVASVWPGTQYPLEHLILLVQYGADLNARDVVHEIIHREHERIGPSTAQERALRDFPRCQAAYILLKSASELDTQLEKTLPDLKARRKIVARHLTILHTVLGYLTGDLFPPFTLLGLGNGPTHQKMMEEVSLVIAPFQKARSRLQRDHGLLRTKA